MNHIYSRSEKHKITVRWGKGPFGLKKMFTVDLLIKSIIGSIINWDVGSEGGNASSYEMKARLSVHNLASK